MLRICKQKNIDLGNVAFIGNDINDKEAMEIVGTRFSPSDAHESIKYISDYVFETKGGEGVIRDLLDFLIKQKGE